MLRREWMSLSISPEDLLAFIFKASIGEIVGEVSAQTGAAGGEAPDDAAAKSVTTVEGCSALGRGEAYRLRSMSAVDKTSAALLLEGQAVGSVLESVGYLSALGSSFRIPGQLSIECTANPSASHRASSYTRAARLIHVWIFGV
ncbi:hypothetical protein COP1_017182 [Malus domestica]